MNKLDRRQKSHLEGSSNESHLGQATWEKQKLPLCKSNGFQETRKLPTPLLQGSQSCPKQNCRASRLFPPTSPGASPAAPPQMLQCSSPFWHPGTLLGLAPAAVSTHLHIHHPHQGKLIRGNQKRGLACEKGEVAPKICLSESKTKPS